MSLLAYSIEIHGKVQGVWYRASAAQEADRLRLKGSVKNQADGSVYIEVCGPEQEILSFISWCIQGPELAEVRKLNINKIEIFNSPSFEILR
jgi:acylphosphatase